MNKLLFTATLAALSGAGTHAAQTPDTAYPERITQPELRTEQDYEAAPELEVEDPIAPGEYELREADTDEMDVEAPDTDVYGDYPDEGIDVDTTGLQPKGADNDRADWMQEPRVDEVSALEPEEIGTAEPLTDPTASPAPATVPDPNR